MDTTFVQLFTNPHEVGQKHLVFRRLAEIAIKPQVQEFLRFVGKESACHLDLMLVPSEVELPMLDRLERIVAEYLILGLSPGDHLMGLLRTQLDEQGVLTSADLNQRRAGEPVCIAGLVAVHQAPPTAKGHHFVTLEDEDGLINVIFRSAVYASVEEIVTTEPLLRIWGVLQRQDGALSVLAQRAVSLYV